MNQYARSEGVSATTVPDGGLAPSACGCGYSGSAPVQLVYALGMLGPTSARVASNSIVEHMEQPANPMMQQICAISITTPGMRR
jgi:hypothetical protein